MFSVILLSTVALRALCVVARPKSNAVWAADSAIARGQGNGLGSSGKGTVSYEHGELQWGLRQLYEKTGNTTYYDYILTGANNIVNADGALHDDYKLSDYSLDPVRTGPTLLYLYSKTNQAKWKKAIETFRTQLNGQPRTAQGWLDGIYMGDIFYAQYTNDFQPTNTTAWADIALQFNLIYNNTLQLPGSANYSGLLYHGYDYSHTAVWANADRGHSPEIWSRALGWYSMALVDILDIFPKSNSAYSSFQAILRDLAPKLRDAADAETGVWWLVMTQPGRAGNYFESSATAMFVYSLLKGVRLGYLPDADGSIVTAAKKAYLYMVNNWVVAKSDGTMDWLKTVSVGSLSGNGTFEYYISVSTDVNDLKGLSAFLLASLELRHPTRILSMADRRWDERSTTTQAKGVSRRPVYHEVQHHILHFNAKLCRQLRSLSVNYFGWTRPESFAVWAADSAIKRGQGNGLTPAGQPTVSYEHGEFQSGLRELYDLTGNQSYFDYIVQGADKIVAENGSVGGEYKFTDFVLDFVRTGPTFLYLYEQTGLAKYKIASDTYRRQLDGQPRTPQGQFWHRLSAHDQGWLDGIYMGELFYAQYTALFQPSNSSAWNDIAAQFDLMFQNTVQNHTAPNTTGLLYHGYDSSHTAVWADADRGHSTEVWDRAVGWYAMALVDVLDLLPPSPPPSSAAAVQHLRQTLLKILRTLAPRLRDAADPTTGVWWLVMTQPGRAKNYFESSGTVMFVYALLRAVRMGYVEDSDGCLVQAARRAYGYILENFVIDNGDGTMGWNGTVIVGSLSTTGDFNYYISQPVDLNDLKGLAAFVLASLEFEKL
ncbi:hypothetical protein DXG01_004328 [Tephrocybe rancida]|nr:hypothetical protein DXG01_004328 [Tephrocybe rancida]